MIRNIKFSKIAIVIFLTVLIWVWTDLDLDEVHTVPNSSIRAAYNRSLLVRFNGRPEASISDIQLRGPAKKIAEVRRRLDDGTLEFDFILNPELEGMTDTGSHTLNVLDFLKRSDTMKQKEFRSLTIEDCEPDIIDVNIVKLVKQPLDVECINENRVPVEVESIDPPQVEMFVPQGRRLKAQVLLTGRDITQARISVAVKTPFIELAGQRRQATTDVKIKMSPEVDPLNEYHIQDAKLGITLSMNLVGEYKPELENYNDLVSFFIDATPEAKNAYESRDFQITLIIPDGAEKRGPDQVQRRELIYNFPQEYLRTNEIRLRDRPKQAEFKLIPLSPAETASAGTD
jgi:hypothetical protein